MPYMIERSSEAIWNLDFSIWMLTMTQAEIIMDKNKQMK